MIPLRDETFVRRNGERVAFSEYGDPNGEPVMFCHGWPSSRLMAQFTHDAARELGCELFRQTGQELPIRVSWPGANCSIGRRLFLSWRIS